MDWASLIDLLKVVAWPLVAAGALILYRTPLSAFVAGLGSRVTKLGVLDFSIELAALPAPPVPWSDPSIPQSSEMTGGEVFSSTLMALFDRIGVATPWDYLVIDIKEGGSWLISRVFIFTVVLQAMRGVQCVVFVRTTAGSRRQLIGLAAPETVRAALAAVHPWLERALAAAMLKYSTVALNPLLPSLTAGNIIRDFIEQPEMRATSAPNPMTQWTRLGVESFWEHTEWLTPESLSAYLGASLYDWDASHYAQAPESSSETEVRALLRRRAPFVALVNSKGEFQRLLDRRKLLEAVAQAL